MQVLSPTKQNISRDAQSSPLKSQRCQNQVIRQILKFVDAKGLKLPNDLLSKAKGSEGSLFKLKSASQNIKVEKQIKELRVKLSDAEFERKKIEEDFAQFKHKSKQQKQKEVKKWEDNYNQLKLYIEDSSENSSEKLKASKEKYEKEMRDIKQQHMKELKEQRQGLVTNYQNQIKYLKQIHSRQIREQVQIQQKELQKAKQTSRLTLQQTNNKNQQEMKSLCNKHKSILQSKERQFQSRFTALLSERKTEQKLHQKTKSQATQIKDKLCNELYYEQKARHALEDEVQKRNGQNRQLKRKIEDLNLDIELIHCKNRQQTAQLHQIYKNQIQNIKQGQNNLLNEIKNKHLLQLQNYTQRIQQLTNLHDQRQSVWMHQTRDLANQFQQRPSKKQDVEMIEKLKNKISKKEQQLRNLSKQLKYCLLQLQNKEQTYTKIFTSQARIDKLSALDHKKSLSRDQRSSKQSLARKSQTSDFKFLLKVYNKQF